MTHTVHRGLAFLLLHFVWQTICICPGPNNDLCSYEGDEFNSTKIESNFSSFCDCEEVILCYVIELSQDCNTPLIKLGANSSLSDDFHCDVASLDSEVGFIFYGLYHMDLNECPLKESQTAFEILNNTGTEFFLKVLTSVEAGKFKFTCQKMNEVFTTLNSSHLEIVGINPSEVSVDSEVELQLTVVKQDAINGTWCFVNTPDNNTEILLASWVSDTQVCCIGFNPRISNFFRISLSTVLTPNIIDNGITVKVTSKHPVAQKAEYNYDFKTIFIYFDINIELHSTCVKVFSKDTWENFGEDFECFAYGNLLVVKMGLQFQHIDNLVIDPDNKICQAGSQDKSEFCLPASPANLTVLKQKLPSPKWSLCMKSACSGSEAQKYVVKVSHYKGSSDSISQNQSLQMKSGGKMQRRNIMVWRKMREIQGKFPRQAVLQVNATDILPILENSQSLDNVLNAEEDILGSSAKVSVLVKSSPTTSIIVAEADVTFCEGSVKMFHYKWLVDGNDVFEEGKLLILKDLTPGMYVIKCLVVAVNSTEILGQGWSSAEVFDNEKKVFIVPFEVTAGIADDISLRAFGWHSRSILWNCRTMQNEPCFTTKMELVSDTIDLKSLNITIPAGVLPVGGYIWTVDSAGGSNTAKVLVKSGNITAIDVEVSSVFVKPEEFVLTGSIRRAVGDCRVWWSSVRELGFSYFHLNTTAESSLGEKFPQEISLAISSENWKEAQPNSLYIFKLQVFCSKSSENQQGSYDYIKVPVVVSNPPRVSPLTVKPTTGKAMITEFMVSGGEADSSVDDYPLTFEWSYVEPCGAEVTMGRGAFGRNFKTYLPPGDLKLKVKVCDGENICSTSSSSMISVLQASEFPVENFRNARNQVEHLITSGDTLEAFGLAITVFKSLALVAESEIRGQMFSTVEEGIKNKIEDLRKKMRSDPKARKLSLEFFDRAVEAAKYFRKGSGIMPLLSEFKNSVNSMRH